MRSHRWYDQPTHRPTPTKIDTMDETHLLEFAETWHLRQIGPAVLLAVLWAIESGIGIGGRQRWIHGLRNLSLAVINAGVLLFTFGMVTMVVARFAAAQTWTPLSWLDQFGWLRFVTAVICLDAWTYAWHRANHRFDFLWRFHRVHHSDTAMNVTTSARFHVGELFMSATLRLMVVGILGISPAQILVHELILVAVSQFHHATIRLGRFDHLLRWLIVTPGLHQIHHSRRPQEMHRNFASILSVWDRLGRSFRAESVDQEIRFGVPGLDDPEYQTTTGMLKTPWRRHPGS